MCGETVTLDLSSPDSSLFSLADDLVYGVSHKAFVPKDGSSLVSVVDDGDTLWTATDTQGCTGAYLFSREGYSSLLSVYTRGAGDETFCFEKDGNQWKNVDKLEFETKLRSMKDLYAPAGEEHREEEFVVEKIEDSPKEPPAESVEVSTLEESEGSEPVERLDDSKIELEFSDEPLENASDQAYTTGIESEYTMKPFAENMKELEYFRKVLLTKTPLPVVDEFTLDISKDPKEHKIELSTKFYKSVTQKKYTPLYGKNKRTTEGAFSQVVEGSAVIWTAQPNERCEYASCLTNKTAQPLLTVAVCGRSDFVAYDRFIKDVSGWKKITIEEFEHKLEDMKKA